MSNFTGYALFDYRLCAVELLKTNKKSYIVQRIGSSEKDRIKPEKYVDKNTPFCVVWEMWKGANGRGAHRLETQLYSHHHNTRNLVWENPHGTEVSTTTRSEGYL